MDIGIAIALALGSALIAGLTTWLIASRRIHVQSLRALSAESELAQAQAVHAERIAAFEVAEQRLRDSFVALSQEALQSNTTLFLSLAQERMERQQQTAQADLSSLVDPLKKALEQQQANLDTIEQARQRAYGSLEEQIRRMTEDQRHLQAETANLVKALRQPQVRGRWGELQLRQVVELARSSLTPPIRKRASSTRRAALFA